jgi:uncharacterized protein YjiS (DUF1127 family)
MASGLLTIAIFGERWRDMMARELPRLIAAQPAPPPAWMSHVQRHLHTQAPQADELERLQGELSDPHDTHPSTNERMQALGIRGEDALSASQLPDQVAGATWLLDWSEVVKRHDEAWRQLHASTWRQEHIRQVHRLGRLEQLRALNDLGLVRADLELEFGEPATVIQLAHRWLDDAGSGSHARLLLGAAQLKNGDRQGVDSLEACIKADPTWALAARELMHRESALLADDAARDRNATLLARAWRKRSRALGEAFELMQQGKLEPAALHEDAWTVLREVYAGVPAVAAAWCAGIDELVHDQRRYRVVVLILRLHTDKLRDMDLSEDEVRDDARALLGGLLPGSTLRLVWTVYTTEPLAPELHALLSQWARAGERCCLVQPKEGESVGAGARAAALR